MRAWIYATSLAIWAAATTAQAENSSLKLDATDRHYLGQAILDVLIDTPAILRPDTPDIGSVYAEEIDADHKLIAKYANRLFSTQLAGVGSDDAALKVALLRSANCDACDRAEAELFELAQTYDLRVFVIDADNAPELADALAADSLPFYVFPKMLLRGSMPAAVLDRYFEAGTGQ